MILRSNLILSLSVILFEMVCEVSSNPVRLFESTTFNSIELSNSTMIVLNASNSTTGSLEGRLKNLTSALANRTSLTSVELTHLRSLVSEVSRLASNLVSSNRTSESSNLRPRRVEPTFRDLIPNDLFRPCSSADIQDQLDESSHSYEVELEDLEEPSLRSSRHIDPRLVGKAKVGLELLQNLIFKTEHLQSLVTEIIRKNLVQECLYLKLPQPFRISPATHMNENLVEGLSSVYQVVANQTAHLYYIWSEHRRLSQRSRGCLPHLSPSLTLSPGADAYSPKAFESAAFRFQAARSHLTRVSEDYLQVSNQLRGLMCHLDYSFRLFDLPISTKAIVDRVLQGPVPPSQQSCSRIALADCVVMRNAVRLFADLAVFLRGQSGRFFGLHHPLIAPTYIHRT